MNDNGSLYAFLAIVFSGMLFFSTHSITNDNTEALIALQHSVDVSTASVALLTKEMRVIQEQPSNGSMMKEKANGK